MQSTSMQSGHCPKCGGADVYTTRGMAKRGERADIAVSSFARLQLDTYVCLQCGHFEEVVAAEDLALNREKIRTTWNRA